MSVFKWKNTVGEWIRIYKDALNRRLKRNKNLADLTDKAAARENLEIYGDNVTSHLHDSTYIPLIDQESTDRQTADNDILAKLNTLKANEDAGLKNLDTSLNKTVSNINQNISNLNNQISASESRLNANITNAINRANLSGSTVSVSGSEIDENAVYANIPCSEAKSRGNSTYYRMRTYKGVSGGTYTLTDLLTALINASHTHSTGYVNCDCNCSSNCEPSVCLPGH